jgi:single-strand DNA-binding protein
MANDLNVVTLIGRLTRDPELTYANSGTAICKFSLAVNRRKKVADNKWEDEASFFDCSMFGKSAESITQYLEKGKQVSILGELRQNRWEQDGQSRSKVEIIVNFLQLLGGGSGQQESAPKAPAQTYGQTTQPRATAQRSNSKPSQYAQTSGNARYGSPSQQAGPRPGRETAGQQEFLGPEAFDDDQIPF